ncbi:MAG TPA: hypothetical protein VFF52_14695, partial [Isosphaeraceae bacterium]|nr:hypothetical protein [Isosphaeraceae bacterium]
MFALTADQSAAKARTAWNSRHRQPALLLSASKGLRKHWQLYLLMVPPILYFVIFKYIPMVGI